MITLRQNRTSHLFSVVIRLSILLPMTVFLLSNAPATLAETWYVKPSAEVPIRSGQGTDYKILSVVPDGLTVSILEEADPWVKVRTEGGTEGWMLKRYLTNDPPLSSRFASLQAQKEKLEQENGKMRLELDELSTANSLNQQELNACIAERDELRNNYQTLQEDTADVIAIKKNLTGKVEEVLLLRQQLTELERKNKNLQNNTSLKWFLAGGLVLITGWVIGLVTGRSRKRKSSLY